MRMKVSLDHEEVLRAIANYVEKKTGVAVEASALKLDVKSKQNWRSEWEQATSRVECEVPEREYGI